MSPSTPTKISAHGGFFIEKIKRFFIMDKSDIKELFEQTLICAAVGIIVFHLHSVFEKPKNTTHTKQEPKTEQLDSLSRDSVITAYDAIKHRVVQQTIKTR